MGDKNAMSAQEHLDTIKKANDAESLTVSGSLTSSEVESFYEALKDVAAGVISDFRQIIPDTLTGNINAYILELSGFEGAYVEASSGGTLDNIGATFLIQEVFAYLNVPMRTLRQYKAKGVEAFKRMVTNLLKKKIAENIVKLAFNGISDAKTSGQPNTFGIGWPALMKASSKVGKVNSNGVTSIISIVRSGLKATSEQAFQDPATKIMMGKADFQKYEDEIGDKNGAFMIIINGVERKISGNDIKVYPWFPEGVQIIGDPQDLAYLPGDTFSWDVVKNPRSATGPRLEWTYDLGIDFQIVNPLNLVICYDQG